MLIGELQVLVLELGGRFVEVLVSRKYLSGRQSEDRYKAHIRVSARKRVEILYIFKTFFFFFPF